MTKICFVLLMLIQLATECFGQLAPVLKVDTTINNLVLPVNYKTSEYGAIPEFRKMGKGKTSIILIPGIGFDASVFDDFVTANKKKYTFYIITIPGYGNTGAPPMPSQGTSYGEQTWNKGVQLGIIKLIEKEKLNRPVIAGSFIQGTQIAIRMAIDYPDNVSKVIAMGGAGKFVYISKGKPIHFPLPGMIAYTDKETAKKFFKSMPSTDFNDGNYLPEIYSLDSTRAKSLWNQPASVPTSVMVRYLCEFFASDVTLELEKIKCPVLVLRPTFNPAVLEATLNNYVKPQFIDAWDNASVKNSLIKVVDIQNAAAFVWKDNPSIVYQSIDNFLMHP